MNPLFALSCDGVNSGTVAGVIDGFCYVGSAIRSYFVVAIAGKADGWTEALVLLIDVSLVCAVLMLVYSVIKNRLSK